MTALDVGGMPAVDVEGVTDEDVEGGVFDADPAAASSTVDSEHIESWSSDNICRWFNWRVVHISAINSILVTGNHTNNTI